MSVILVGKNSRLYKSFRYEFDCLIDCAISHAEVSNHKFKGNDVIILLSYSDNLEDQMKLLEGMKKAAVSRIIVFSSAAAIVGEKFSCYKYPTVKLNIEKAILDCVENYKIVRLGTVIDDASSGQYKGMCVTYISDLMQLLTDELSGTGDAVNGIVSFFKYAKFKDKTTFEFFLYRKYTVIISALKWPCFLRPIDLLIKFLFGYKWYGYGVLSAVLSDVLENYE